MKRCLTLGSTLAIATLGLGACGGSSSSGTGGGGGAGGMPPVGGNTLVAGAHSTTITISKDGKELYVVNPDADSVSVLDVATRKLSAEILLADSHPKVASNKAYTPSVLPRELALSSDGNTLYVTGERSSKLYAIDVASRKMTNSVEVGSEPFGLAASDDGEAVFVACSQDATVVRVDAHAFKVTATVTTPAKPWGIGASSDGTELWVTHLLGAAVSAIDPSTMTLKATWEVPATAPRGNPELAHGVARGLYDVAARPKSTDIWVVHQLLGIDTAQPTLDFESTAFPALTLLHADGSFDATLSTDAPDVTGVDGAFGDVVSGPQAVAFTSDGKFAILVDTASEDLLFVDADQEIESTLLRPLPGHMPEGIVLSPDETFAYVDQRNTGDVAVVKLNRTADGFSPAVDGSPIARMTTDPMPAELRLGQHLFYSANSDEYRITQNHWIACATCHMEGRSDAVTWRFAQGPRDTPSNAGGTDGTGFLFRTADRTKVQDYYLTINTEQGGKFAVYPTNAGQAKLLDALAEFVNHAIPLPVPPSTLDQTLVAKGKTFFESKTVGCSGCHSGPRFTDSGSGNPNLDLKGPILLHDVGTCVTQPYPDKAHLDIDGNKRAACMFDTPSLSGVSDSAPYLHDGSAATLRDVLEKTRGKMGDITSLSSSDVDALVEYLRSL